MAITFDPINQRVILDTNEIAATEIYSRWVDWSANSDNLKYGMLIRQVGGDDLGAGLSIPPYFFLQADWRIRPMEADHDLTVSGNLFVEGGGVPVVRTLGSYQVNVKYVVPVQAQGIVTSGATISYTEIAKAVRSELALELGQISTYLTDTYFAKIQTVLDKVSLILDINEGSWELQNNQMLFYNANAEEIMRFNLFDSKGAPSTGEVFKRARVA